MKFTVINLTILTIIMLCVFPFSGCQRNDENDQSVEKKGIIRGTIFTLVSDSEISDPDRSAQFVSYFHVITSENDTLQLRPLPEATASGITQFSDLMYKGGATCLLRGEVSEDTLFFSQITVARNDQDPVRIAIYMDNKAGELHDIAFNCAVDRLAKYDVTRKNVDRRNMYGATPLALAILTGCVEVATSLIEHGADVNAEDVSHFTPIFAAVEIGDTSLVRLLLSHGAKIDVVNYLGTSVLYHAVSSKQIDVARILLAEGITPEKQRSDGLTELHIAAHIGSSEAISLLIEAGASINIQNSEGETPLHFASSRGHEAAFVSLVSNGADMTILTNNGKSAVDVASESMKQLFDSLTIVTKSSE